MEMGTIITFRRRQNLIGNLVVLDTGLTSDEVLSGLQSGELVAEYSAEYDDRLDMKTIGVWVKRKTGEVIAAIRDANSIDESVYDSFETLHNRPNEPQA